MPSVLQLGVNEHAVHGHLERPATGGDERERFNTRLIGFEQFSRQTGGFWCVVSDSAVFDGDDHDGFSLGEVWLLYRKVIPERPFNRQFWYNHVDGSIFDASL